MPLRGLTNEQIEVVNFEGNLLLTACPGSGKTKTLVSKIAFLLAQEKIIGTKRRVIAITYTNVAAETILDRLDNYGVESDCLWVGTIHSFCLEWILKPYLRYIERLSKGYRVLDEYEQRKLLNEIKEKFSLNFFDNLPTRLNERYEIDAAKGSKYYDAVSEYHNILRDNRWIDFDLILTISLNALRAHPSIGRRLSDLFMNVMLDEYQDTNQQQYDILASIIKHGRTIVTLIGDVDQAIYTGLGAVVKDKNQIKSEFFLQDISEKTLSGCYRSTQSIIDFYRFFQDNPINIKSLSSLDQAKTGIFHNDDISREQLGEFIKTILTKYISEGVDANEIVILAPQWTDVMNLGLYLRQTMPYLEFNAPSISPIPKSQDNYWFNLVRLFFTKINSKNYSKRQRLAVRVIDDMKEMGFSFSADKNLIKKILKTVNSIQLDMNCEIEKFIELLVFSFSTSFNFQIEKNGKALEAKSSLIDATTDRIKKHNLKNHALTLPSYFNSTNGIDITTCHSTKGEEYDVVIATGLLQGKLPHWNDIYDQSIDSDYMARRLLYVISSRARKYLYLVSEKGHTTKKGVVLVTTPQLASALSRGTPI